MTCEIPDLEYPRDIECTLSSLPSDYSSCLDLLSEYSFLYSITYHHDEESAQKLLTHASHIRYRLSILGSVYDLRTYEFVCYYEHKLPKMIWHGKQRTDFLETCRCEIVRAEEQHASCVVESEDVETCDEIPAIVTSEVSVCEDSPLIPPQQSITPVVLEDSLVCQEDDDVWYDAEDTFSCDYNIVIEDGQHVGICEKFVAPSVTLPTECCPISVLHNATCDWPFGYPALEYSCCYGDWILYQRLFDVPFISLVSAMIGTTFVVGDYLLMRRKVRKKRCLTLRERALHVDIRWSMELHLSK